MSKKPPRQRVEQLAKEWRKDLERQTFGASGSMRAEVFVAYVFRWVSQAAEEKQSWSGEELCALYAAAQDVADQFNY